MIYLDKGYIAPFEMSDPDAGKRQLEGYIRQLKDAGHSRIVAPIAGDTWHSYRLVSWTNGDPAFPLEPQNPLWYNEVYTSLGFTPLKIYRSDKFCLEGIAPTPTADPALSIRPFREGDLRLIYDLSLAGFAGNFLYSEISFEAFCQLYAPILPMLDRDLAVIAEMDGAPAGFMFSLLAGDLLILKTMAVLPAFRSKGIGALLINHLLRTAQAKGAKTAVAALMSDGNNSQKIVAKHGAVQMREYTLYSLEV